MGPKVEALVTYLERHPGGARRHHVAADAAGRAAPRDRDLDRGLTWARWRSPSTARSCAAWSATSTSSQQARCSTARPGPRRAYRLWTHRRRAPGDAPGRRAAARRSPSRSGSSRPPASPRSCSPSPTACASAGSRSTTAARCSASSPSRPSSRASARSPSTAAGGPTSPRAPRLSRGSPPSSPRRPGAAAAVSRAEVLLVVAEQQRRQEREPRAVGGEGRVVARDRDERALRVDGLQALDQVGQRAARGGRSASARGPSHDGPRLAAIALRTSRGGVLALIRKFRSKTFSSPEDVSPVSMPQ